MVTADRTGGAPDPADSSVRSDEVDLEGIEVVFCGEGKSADY
jgi:hypothetical protein